MAFGLISAFKGTGRPTVKIRHAAVCSLHNIPGASQQNYEGVKVNKYRGKLKQIINYNVYVNEWLYLFLIEFLVNLMVYSFISQAISLSIPDLGSFSPPYKTASLS